MEAGFGLLALGLHLVWEQRNVLYVCLSHRVDNKQNSNSCKNCGCICPSQHPSIQTAEEREKKVKLLLFLKSLASPHSHPPLF